MRKLNTTQKKLLKNWSKEREIFHIDDLTYEEFKKIENLGDFETLHQEVNRFLSDL